MNDSNALIEAPRHIAQTSEVAATYIIHGSQESALAKALSTARDKCMTATKDSKNTFHRYSYASADEVIDVAKTALEGTGLSLVPTCPKIKVSGSGNMAFYALVRKFILIHTSGEVLPLGEIEWPVIPDKGKPLDKALAIAITSSLSYLYRDLLAMPRGTGDGMDNRDDRGAPPAGNFQADNEACRNGAGYQAMAPDDARPAVPHPGPDQPQTLQETLAGEEPISEDQKNELSALIRETGADGHKLVKDHNIPVLAKLPLKHFATVRNDLLARKRAGTVQAPAPTTATPAIYDVHKLLDLRRQVDELIKQLGISPEAFKVRLKEICGTGDSARLTIPQLEEVVTRLTKKLQEVQPAMAEAKS